MTTNEPAEAGLTVASCDLRRILRDTLPFTGYDSPLDVVCLEAVGGVLTATATDRFTLGHARTACRGEFGRRIVISRADAAVIKRMLPRSSPYTAAEQTTLVDDGSALSLRIAVGSRGQVGLRFTTSQVTFPDYVKVLAKVTDDPAGQPFALNPRFVSRFAKIADRGGIPLRFFVHNSLSRIFVEAGPDFIGAIMPVRRRPDMPSEPTVPMGHALLTAARSTEDRGEPA
jgi:hypothetical protein